MFSKKNKKRAFTLIEMLIVIVIIGVLAAALIPRLSSARGRANDVARKSDLSQTAAAIVAYQIDNGSFMSCWSTPTGCPLSSISTGLISAWMNSIPSDPQSDKSFLGLGTTIANGQYGYTTLTKWWIWKNGFVIMAGTETEGWSNYTVWTGFWTINANTDYSTIKLCKSFDSTCTPAVADWNWKCCYNKTADQLRYIYLY